MSQHRAAGLTTAQPPWTVPTGVSQVLDLEAGQHDWERTPGTLVHGYAYNGQVPGPVIEATVGDTLLVRFTNRLAEPTSIHWHGIRIPAADGGNDPGGTVPPGGTADYRFSLPDAGTFWYHPHVREPVQLARGLYGAIVVRDPAEPRLDGERVLVFDDLTLNRTGQVPAGQLERWRLVNAASASYVHLSLGGHRFHVLGTDGGLIPAPEPVAELVMTPGDRYDLAVGPLPSGVTLALEALPHNRASDKPRRHTLARLHTGELDGDSTLAASVDLRQFGREIPPLAGPAMEPTRTIRLGGRFPRHDVEGRVNGSPHVYEAPVRVGELQVWELTNDTGLDHPFHLHGFFFQVLCVNGTPPSYRSWEDTINVPAHGYVRIAWLPDDRPGRWMYHCQVLEHHGVDMVGSFEVVA